MKPLVFMKRQWKTITLFILSVITVSSLWPKQAPPVPGSDKLHHMLAYAMLMVPATLGRPDQWKRFSLLFIAYSGMIEGVQPLVNRHGDWLDLAANAVGVGCGAIIAALIHSRYPAPANPSRQLFK